MKKLIAGFIAGALFMVSAQAFGDGISFVGKKVNGETPVTIDSKVVGNAIIINGKSFAPVRELTNGFGGKVDSATSGGIALSSGTNSDTLGGKEKQIFDLKQKISGKQADIELATKKINEIQTKVDERKAQNISADVQEIELNTTKQVLKNQEKELADLEDQLEELQK